MFCHPAGWQITRELLIFVYPGPSIQSLVYLSKKGAVHDLRVFQSLPKIRPPPFCADFKAVLVEIEKVRNWCGTSSGTQARLTFERMSEHNSGIQRKWTISSDEMMQADTVQHRLGFFEDLALRKGSLVRQYSTTTRLLQVTRHGRRTDTQDDLFSIPPDADASGAVIGMRPNSWPAPFPDFSVFTLERTDQLNKVSLARLLEATVWMRTNFFAGGEGPISMGQMDKLIVAEWVKALKE